MHVNFQLECKLPSTRQSCLARKWTNLFGCSHFHSNAIFVCKLSECLSYTRTEKLFKKRIIFRICLCIFTRVHKSFSLLLSSTSYLILNYGIHITVYFIRFLKAIYSRVTCLDFSVIAREVVHAPSLDIFRVGLDGDFKNSMIGLKVSMLRVFKSPFQLKPFSDSAV